MRRMNAEVPLVVLGRRRHLAHLVVSVVHVSRRRSTDEREREGAGRDENAAARDSPKLHGSSLSESGVKLEKNTQLDANIGSALFLYFI